MFISRLTRYVIAVYYGNIKDEILEKSLKGLSEDFFIFCFFYENVD